MDVIFAATNKFLQFLSGFSHTHRFCYQLVNLCIRHYGIRFPWVKCWPNQRENNVAEKLMFPSSIFPSTPRNIFFLLFFRISSHDVYLDRRQSRVLLVCIFFFFVIAERILLLDSWDLKSQKCSKSCGITAAFSSSSRTFAQLDQSMCQKKKKKASMISPVMFKGMPWDSSARYTGLLWMLSENVCLQLIT